MFASVRKYRLKVGTHEEFNRVANEGFLPIISGLPGFVAYFGVDTAGDEWVSLSIFESKAAAEESNRRAADFIGQNLKPLVASGPEVVVGDLAVSRRA